MPFNPEITGVTLIFASFIYQPTCKNMNILQKQKWDQTSSWRKIEKWCGCGKFAVNFYRNITGTAESLLRTCQQSRWT